jgi:curved DNA-binding protein CbpA
MTDPPPSPYATLSIPPTASLAVIKAAFRTAARRTHPDRQHKERGSEGHAPPPPPPSPSFAAARAAYETLADPARRAAWDACAAVAPGGVAPPPASAARATAARRAARAAGGGEDALLAGWAPPGPVSAPSSALVITCEACRRPATAACWVCGMDLCAYCTRTPHWKVG